MNISHRNKSYHYRTNLRTLHIMRRCCGIYCVFSIKGESLCMQVRKARSRLFLSSGCCPNHMRSMLGVFQSTGLAITTSNTGLLVPRRTTHSFTSTSNDLGALSPVVTILFYYYLLNLKTIIIQIGLIPDL